MLAACGVSARIALGALATLAPITPATAPAASVEPSEPSVPHANTVTFFRPTISSASASFCISAEPAHLLHTFLAGQPILMSMICAPRSML